MPTPMTANEIQAGLRQFTGSEHFYRLNALAPWMLGTDGILWLCEQAYCYWLADAIVSHQRACRKDSMLCSMQFWCLKVDLATHKAVLTCERDTDDVAITQEIPYTDFPLPEIKLWVEGVWGQQMTMMLPSER